MDHKRAYLCVASGGLFSVYYGFWGGVEYPSRKLKKGRVGGSQSGSFGNEMVFMDICVSGMTEGLVIRDTLEIELFHPSTQN